MLVLKNFLLLAKDCVNSLKASMSGNHISIIESFPDEESLKQKKREGFKAVF